LVVRDAQVLLLLILLHLPLLLLLLLLAGAEDPSKGVALLGAVPTVLRSENAALCWPGQLVVVWALQITAHNKAWTQSA
jgi:hypothetical protein